MLQGKNASLAVLDEGSEQCDERQVKPLEANLECDSGL